jgi:hypothetical protein
MAERLFLFIYQDDDGAGNHYVVELTKPSQLAWLHQKLGICPLKDRLKNLEDKIYNLEEPQRIAKLKELLAKEPQGRTAVWILNRLIINYWELRDFAVRGILEKTRKGHTYLYKLKEA